MSHDTYEDVLKHPEEWLDARQRHWLRPRGMLARLGHAALYFVNWVAMRLIFNISVEGREHLPGRGPFILAPNHSSRIDPPCLGATLGLSVLQHTYWCGKRRTVLKNSFHRFISWIALVIPIDSDHTALAPAAKVLEQGDNLIWFPEGTRSRDGSLQEFKSGIAHLVAHCDVPVIPIFIRGAHAAILDGESLPRFRAKIVVCIGPARSAAELGLSPAAEADMHSAAEHLRQHLAQLGEPGVSVPKPN